MSTKKNTSKVKTKKAKAKTPATLKKRLWELCKQIIRITYGPTCYTCGKKGLEGASWQTGHFIPSGSCGAYLRYDLRNLRPQCYFCNINNGGAGATFYRNLVANEGQEYVDQIFKDKNIIVKADVIWLQNKIDEYEKILNDLQ